mmetsp:Transcript_18715/g.45026  ORF Transcript_18715/g.45026 Transcript_18715/m.45026 type:complete len:273 (-) Transcript_18715:39-857(-)
MYGTVSVLARRYTLRIHLIGPDLDVEVFGDLHEGTPEGVTIREPHPYRLATAQSVMILLDVCLQIDVELAECATIRAVALVDLIEQSGFVLNRAKTASGTDLAKQLNLLLPCPALIWAHLVDTIATVPECHVYEHCEDAVEVEAPTVPQIPPILGFQLSVLLEHVLIGQARVVGKPEREQLPTRCGILDKIPIRCAPCHGRVCEVAACGWRTKQANARVSKAMQTGNSMAGAQRGGGPQSVYCVDGSASCVEWRWWTARASFSCCGRPLPSR